MLNKFKNLIYTHITMGREDQTFLGAKWVAGLLRLVPQKLKRPLALRFLALSPHYFYRIAKPEYKGMAMTAWLESEYERNRSTREKLCGQVLLPFLQSDYHVLDIGCGPGFLAKAAASHVEKVYACDISSGVLECARTINSGPNIKFINSGQGGFQEIPDSSLDVIYSFAVIQHVRESGIRFLFEVIARKLRCGGTCLLQVQLDDEKWRHEEEWVQDKSLIGRMKWRYALNFFPRSIDFFRRVSSEVGLSMNAVRPMSEVMESEFDDVYHQHIIEFSKG